MRVSKIDRGSITGRAALEGRTIHMPDVLADPEFDQFEWQRVGKQRTVLGVPLLREEGLIGVIILARTQVEPFDAAAVADVRLPGVLSRGMASRLPIWAIGCA